MHFQGGGGGKILLATTTHVGAFVLVFGIFEICPTVASSGFLCKELSSTTALELLLRSSSWFLLGTILVTFSPSIFFRNGYFVWRVRGAVQHHAVVHLRTLVTVHLIKSSLMDLRQRLSNTACVFQHAPRCAVSLSFCLAAGPGLQRTGIHKRISACAEIYTIAS